MVSLSLYRNRLAGAARRQAVECSFEASCRASRPATSVETWVTGRYVVVASVVRMDQVVSAPEPMVVRQVFPRWTITIPADFDETFLAEDGYWHAWDERRSVSLTSVAISDRHGRRVSAARILKRIVNLIPVDGDEHLPMPAGLDGWAVTVTTQQPARASRAITGIIAVDGTVLVATITSDDLSWAMAVWLSVRRGRTPGDA